MLDYQKVRAAITKHILKEEGVKQSAAAPKPAKVVDDNDVPADLDAIMASTEKLLAVNKGLTEPDERDSLRYRKIYTPDKLMAERVSMDAGKVRQTAMRRLAKFKNLSAIGTNHFDSYAEGLIVGHMLSSPLEEINPMHLVEQSRRITSMGPGGLPSDESITEEAQNLHPSQFGFYSAIEGPESERIGVDVRAAWGTKIGSDGKIYQRFNNRRTGKKQWLSPTDVANKVVGLPD